MSALLVTTDCAANDPGCKSAEALAGPKRPADGSPDGSPGPGGEESVGVLPSCPDGMLRLIDKDGTTTRSSVVETIVAIGKNL